MRAVRRNCITCGTLAWLLGASLTNVAVAEPLQVVETSETIVVQQGDTLVLSYNKVSPPVPAGIDSICRRSGCLHPVGSPGGRIVTAMFPLDHPHQQGIFSAWVNTTYDGQAVNFWDLAGGTRRVLHERCRRSRTTTQPGSRSTWCTARKARRRWTCCASGGRSPSTRPT